MSFKEKRSNDNEEWLVDRIEVVYFKTSGKYYTTSTFEIPKTSIENIHCHAEYNKYTYDNSHAPGLSSYGSSFIKVITPIGIDNTRYTGRLVKNEDE